MLKLTLLFFILLVAAIFDVKTRRIPNFLNFGAVMVGFLLNSLPGSPGILFSIKGFLVGILLLLLPWLTGMIGAGDVKLLGIIGAFYGASIVLDTVLWFAILVLVVFVIIGIKNRRVMKNIALTKDYLMLSLLTRRFVNATKTKATTYIPYAPYIFLAYMLQLLVPLKGWMFV